MKIIQYLSDKMQEEIHDAHEYAEKALEMRDSDKTLADNLFELSTEEMRHMQILHAQAERIIAQYRKEKGEPPAAMLAVYDYLHKKQIEAAGEVKALQALYKEI